MGKFPTALLLLLLSALAAALFGALHNQISFSVGPTYFTGIKFPQFGIDPDLPPRLGAALVGIRASWWMGAIVGLPAFLYGLFAVPTARTYLAAGLGAIFAVLLLATLGALLGLLAGLVADATGMLDAMIAIPEGPTRSDLLRAGLMHEASYLAGALGALAAFLPMRRARRIDLLQSAPEKRHAAT